MFFYLVQIDSTVPVYTSILPTSLYSYSSYKYSTHRPPNRYSGVVVDTTEQINTIFYLAFKTLKSCIDQLLNFCNSRSPLLNKEEGN
jgi:hypothetical protein